jgi:hypothetical protein
MAKIDWPVPTALNPAGEPVKVLAAAKKKLFKKFKWSQAQCLYDATFVAVLLHVFGRDDEALDLCRELSRIPFDGKFRLWTAVEQALVLQARILRQRGEATGAAECLRRVRDAGFVDDRLAGSMLDRNGAVAEAVRTGDDEWELRGRVGMAKELAFVIELGGSDACPVDRMEGQWRENLDRLRVLAGAA